MKNEEILDKNNNVIEKGDVIRVFDKGFRYITIEHFEYLGKLGKRFNSLKIKNPKQYQYSEEEKVYYEIDENGKKVEWCIDYEKEVIEIDNKLCLGFEGGVIFLDMGLENKRTESRIFEIIRKGNKK